ncbi:raffinose/stachyose/melibiose transport system permease protein [Microbacterium pseudoresistens]|uniref:Raffinose/stachyose/melibiose transport system permease protein n=1 Tax=Microbacterium pseudoresistens TaxID=640634 RepID=A0A7Y9EVX0_9MICO|nr:raffinose/stachyose/melibiose transport system permease protein [Microbacterium pseudoresistens]
MPLYLLTVSTFKSTLEIYQNPLGLPEAFTLDNFVEAWVRADFSTYSWNSLVVTVGSILLTLLLALLASYPISRFRSWWATPMLGFFLLGLLVPVRLASVELFMLMKDLGLLNSHLGLILVYTATRLPFAIFILSNFMRAVPVELEEAARLDGAGHVRLLWSVLTPQVRPAVGIVTIFTAIAVWNDFYFPLLFIFDPKMRTLPLGLSTFVGQYGTDWGVLFAGLLLSMLPLALLFLFTSKQVREGVGAGGVK